MADMADALAKAGLISQQKADKVERDKQKAAAEEKKNQRTSGQQLPMPERKIPTSPEYAKIEEMWNNSKSKGFVKHLIWSFVPHSKVDKIWEDEGKYEKKCCICHTGTMSINESVKCVGEDAGKSLLKRCEFELQNQDRKDDAEYKKEYETFMKEMGKEMFGGKLLALHGEDSKKVFCFVCYDMFYAWLMERVLKGDNEIQHMMTRLRTGTKPKKRQ